MYPTKKHDGQSRVRHPITPNQPKRNLTHSDLHCAWFESCVANLNGASGHPQQDFQFIIINNRIGSEQSHELDEHNNRNCCKCSKINTLGLNYIDHCKIKTVWIVTYQKLSRGEPVSPSGLGANMSSSSNRVEWCWIVGFSLKDTRDYKTWIWG